MSHGWLEHPFGLKLAHALLDRHERTTRRPTRLALDDTTSAELTRATTPEEGALLESVLTAFVATGTVRLLTRPRRHPAPLRDREPRLELVDEAGLRALLDRPVPGPDWQQRFIEEAQAAFADAPQLLAYLKRSPLRSLESLAPREAVEGLRKLRAWADEGVLLRREASARAFGGLSKALDGRAELLRLLTGQDDPFPEAPVQLLCVLPRKLERVLWVENLATFEQMASRTESYEPGTALLYSAGFRGSAQRLRHAPRRALYVRHEASASTTDGDALLRWLDGAATLQAHFFGDLDFAGMSILRALREAFGEVRAWCPGYEALLVHLREGRGHRPQAAGKQGQADPGQTGCAYADAVLLPALRDSGLCVDQEAWHGANAP